MKDEPTIEVMLDELEDAASLESSEQGEWWAAITELRKQIFDCASDYFRQAWEAEVVADYRLLKSEYRVVEETRTRTDTVRRLEYVG